MKNIHILLTEQSSRLFMTKSNKLVLDMDNPPIECIAAQHIYITSDEELKEGDWWFHSRDKIIFKVTKEDVLVTNQDGIPHGFYKIILTTDTNLIEDGVQAIDDEFLEWFVKNPSCEFVEVKFETLWLNKRFGGTWQPFPDETATVRKKNHKIIIPKVEPKQETLEEAAEKEFPLIDTEWCRTGACEEENLHLLGHRKSFIKGAKWQAEISYSEDEVRALLIKALTHNDYDLCGSLATRDWEIRTANFEVWFGHNKK